MLRTINPQLMLWESILPECCLGLPGDLAEIDELLDDERFFEPFRPFFDPVIGRPSIPIETYLRMMFLMYRYRLGYEPVCRRWPTPRPGGAPSLGGNRVQVYDKAPVLRVETTINNPREFRVGAHPVKRVRTGRMERAPSSSRGSRTTAFSCTVSPRRVRAVREIGLPCSIDAGCRHVPSDPAARCISRPQPRHSDPDRRHRGERAAAS